MFSRLAQTGTPHANSDSDDPVDDAPSADTCKKAILDLIGKETKLWQEWQEDFKEKEQLELDATVSSLALPSKEVIEKILRYETAIERQLYRAIDQLERLQRGRKGEAIPPPVNLRVSTEN